MALIPTTSYDPTSPAGSQAISLGDDAIRLLKVQIQEVINVDHDFPSSGQAADNGQHKQVTLQEQANLGTGAVGATILGSQTVSGKGELVYTDEDDNDVQITSGGKIKAESIAGVYPAANVAALATMMNLIYPIGFVVTLGVSTNPGTLFGVGTWTAISGKVIVGIDAGQTEFDTLDETGGEKTHTLTGAESGENGHNHLVFYDGTTNAAMSASNYPARIYSTSGDAYTDVRGHTSVPNVGLTSSVAAANAASAHNNLQPYIVKYVWQRTA
jgi:microcystin-dependent protein